MNCKEKYHIDLRDLVVKEFDPEKTYCFLATNNLERFRRAWEQLQEEAWKGHIPKVKMFALFIDGAKIRIEQVDAINNFLIEQYGYKLVKVDQ